LLIALNAAVAGLLSVFLFMDYYREIADRIAEKHLAMEEEAKTLLHAVMRVKPQGVDAVQRYVDSVCGHMQDSHSPGHHITVAYDGRVIQASAHGRASAKMLDAVRKAADSPTNQSSFDGEVLVVGRVSNMGITVYVSEYLTNVLRAIRKQVVFRLGQIVLLGVVIEIVVSFVLVRMVAKPLEKLVATVKQITRGQLGIQIEGFKSAEFLYLADSINEMSSSLAKVERQRQLQMAKARRIQEHLLPREVIVPGLEIAHFYQPAAEIAGDYFDVLELPDGSWLICVADVTGHGIPAAMSAAMLKALLLHAIESNTELAEIFQFINCRFAEISLPEDFVTMLLIRWNPKPAIMEYGSAGHESAWFRTDDGQLHELCSTGMPLAVENDATWEIHAFPVNPGDRLLLATDGVVETFNSDDEPFGRQRLAESFSANQKIPITEMTEQLKQMLIVHRGGALPTDDSTLVAIEFCNQNAITAQVA
jgi:serine phosphatase RsbU (regulator of sigma subunit)